MGGSWPKLRSLDELEGLYGIRYHVGDTRILPDRSVDCVCSTSVLEHVPEPELPGLLAECRRVLKPGGVMTHRIDYHDHYATADPSIGRFHFYRYGALWSLFNPAMHYQNRLRHADFEALFHDFELLVNRRIPSTARLEKLHARFRRYSAEDLRANNGLFVLRHGP